MNFRAFVKHNCDNTDYINSSFLSDNDRKLLKSKNVNINSKKFLLQTLSDYFYGLEFLNDVNEESMEIFFPGIVEVFKYENFGPHSEIEPISSEMKILFQWKKYYIIYYFNVTGHEQRLHDITHHYKTMNEFFDACFSVVKIKEYKDSNFLSSVHNINLIVKYFSTIHGDNGQYFFIEYMKKIYGNRNK